MNESKYWQTLDLLFEGVQIIDFNWRYVYVNKTLLGYQKTTKEALLGITVMSRFPNIEQTQTFQLMEQCMTERVAREIENQFNYPDGTSRWFKLKMEPVEEGILILSIDITQQKEDEIKIKKINRLYTFLSQINQEIVHVKDEETLFKNACRIAFEYGKFKMAWIGLFDHVNKKIDLADHSGILDEDLPLFTNASFHNKGPQNHVLSTGQYYFSNDIHQDLELENWRTYAEKRTIGSCIVLPIKKAEEIIGTFNLYATEVNFSEQEEIDLLSKVAENISFALDIFEKTKKQKETEELIAKNEKRFRNTLDSMLEGAQILDFDWRYVYVNDVVVSHSKTTKENLLSSTLLEIYPGIEQTDLFKAMQHCMTERVQKHMENEFVFPDGSISSFELSIQPIPEGLFVLSVDISKRKKAEEELLKMNRLYAFTSAINQSIVHITDQQELLDKACDVAIKIGQFKMAWIRLLDENKRLNVVSMRGDETEAKKLLKFEGLDYNDPILDIIPSGKALKTGVVCFVNDAQNDPALAPWKEEFIRQEIFASIALPIKKFGETIGVFGLHVSIKNFFDEAEIVLLNEAAGDISFALENFEKAKRHKESEGRLLKYERRYRALIEKSVDLKTLSTEEGILMYGSPSVTKVLGYTLNEFLRRPSTDFIHPEDISGLLKNREELLKNEGKTIEFLYRFLHKNGHWLWCEGTHTNMLHEPGVEAVVSNFRDISEKKMVQEQLIKSEVFNRGVLNALSAQIAVVDGNGTIVAVNESWKRFAIENGEASLKHTGDGCNYFEVCEKAVASGDKVAEEVLIGIKMVMDSTIPFFYFEYPCHAPHEKRWFALRVLKFDSSEPMAVLAHMDISERKLVEEKLIVQNDELQKTNAELDRFVYSASHDLRSPLTSVLGLISFIEDESRESNTLEYAKMIRSSINRLDGFIKNILHYSRNNRTELDVERIHIQKTINEVVDSLLYIKEADGIAFEVNVNEDEHFYSDKQRFSTLVENLISNAIKYHKHEISDKYIRITGNTDRSNLYLRIEDNGIGIETKYHAKIFDMFFRLASPMAGSGIGLYIVKEIVEKLEGSIWVKSEMGVGTAFSVQLKNQVF